MALAPARRPHRKLDPPGTPDRRTPLGVLGDTLPDESRVERTVTQRIRSGKLRSKQKMWCDALVVDSLWLSQAALCRKYQTDPATVRGILAAYQDGQDPRPIARRSVARVLELTTDRLKQVLEDGSLPLKCLPILWGIAHDKLVQLDAGVIPGTEGKTQIEVNANAASAVLDVFERLKALKAGAAALPTAEVKQLPSKAGGEGVSDGDGQMG